MADLNLLFPSQMLGMVNGYEAEHEFVAGPDSYEREWTTSGEGPDENLLPSGIASMEHWLDLNA